MFVELRGDRWLVGSPDRVGSKDSMVNTHICLDLIGRVKIFFEQPFSLLRYELVGWYLRPPVVVFVLLVPRSADFPQVVVLD